MSDINELQWYPEIDQYILVNNYLGTETRITIAQVREKFGELEADKILTNRNDYWTLIQD